MKNVKRKGSIIILLLFLALLLTIGFLAFRSLNTGNTGSISIDLYYMESNTSLIKPENREIKDGDKKELLSSVLTELKNGPKTEGYTKLIPDNVIFQKVTLDGTMAIVDVSKQYLDMKAGEELLARASVVWTLTGLEFVNSVKITADGQELTKTNGEPIGEMGREDFVIDAALSPEPVNHVKVKLYFTNSQATGLETEEREIAVNPNEPVEKYVMEQLIAGPESEDLIATVPPETKIRDIKTVDGICYVDLSAEFVSKHGGGSTGELLTVYSIVNSLTELTNIKKVQFLIEGEKVDEFKGHLDFGKPFEKMEVHT